jgi:multimeric flavodoxin WrbA
MKVLIVNGSPRVNGNTGIALGKEKYGLPEVEKVRQWTHFIG